MSYNNNPTHGSIYAHTLQAYSWDHTSMYVVYKFKHTHTHHNHYVCFILCPTVAFFNQKFHYRQVAFLHCTVSCSTSVLQNGHTCSRVTTLLWDTFSRGTLSTSRSKEVNSRTFRPQRSSSATKQTTLG